MTEAERAYYDQRAPEYDDWYFGTGLFEQRIRPGWAEELAALRAVHRFAPLHFLLGCGLRHWLSDRDFARSCCRAETKAPPCWRSPAPGSRGGAFVRGDALNMPFRSAQFDCLVAAHFYGHLDETARRIFLTEARRISKSILMIDAAARDDVPAEEHQERVLKDGSRHVVYKRYFTPESLIAELGVGRVLHFGRWFVAVWLRLIIHKAGSL